jgi:hypothetical protein
MGMLFLYRIFTHIYFTFFSVSLKTKLAAIDLHQLISEVYRRVEHEVTFEGNEQRIKFVLFSYASLIAEVD